jgi:preprotein translocase subunit SecA
LRALCGALPGAWRSARGREELAEQALAALALYQRDAHYLVADGKVQIVDEYTGRVMPDRSWERGLHQLIEVKEECEVSGRRTTLARITYQRLFRRFLRLCGMTGTAREVAPELEAVYGLRVVRIPTNRPARRSDLGQRLYATAEHKWTAVAEAVARVSGAGRPALVGTRSVAASEELSARLASRGLEHVVLNARQDGDEAQIVARAGETGRITVATNMAGRGTDIRLGAEVAARGGLHVILTEFHESARIDRQLYGRCARQGDPGSFEAIVCLDDDIFRKHGGALARILAARHGGAPETLPGWAAAALQRVAQGSAEAANSRARQATLDLDRQFDQALSFAGRGE